MSLNVALLQLLPCAGMDETQKKGMAACEKAKAMGADIAVFPEMWSTGYALCDSVSAFKARAVSRESPFVTAFGALARTLCMAIGITYLEAYEPCPRNTITVFDRFGHAALTYAKVHTCDFDTERFLTPGDAFKVADLNTARGTVKIGAMICYDREFPESARVLMLKGAELLLVPNACPMEINRISQLRARAFENMLGIATVNYPAGQPDCNGHSTAFDGVAYWALGDGQSRNRDTMILDAGESEGVYIADFPLEEMRAYRRREVHGNAYRRPSMYAPLLDETVQEPFIRNRRRR